MCEFISAIKKQVKGKDKYYFLTAKDLATPNGEILRKKYAGTDNVWGHTAIREFYGLREGEGWEWEETDFSTPTNFPPEIVEAIKAGAFRGMGYPTELLTAAAQKAYNEARATAQKAYYEARATAEKAYYEARATAEKAYNEAIAPANKAYYEARATAEKAYNEAIATAEKAYDEARATALKAYYEARNYLWVLFADPENRAEAWR